MGPLSFLGMLPTSAFGNALKLPGENLPFLPARFMANLVKQAVSPDYPDVPLPLRMMANMPPQRVMGRMADAIGLPETGYPAPIRAVQGALSALKDRENGGRNRARLDNLSGTSKSKSCSSNPLPCLLGNLFR